MKDYTEINSMLITTQENKHQDQRRVDRRAMDGFERVQLWMKIYKRASELKISHMPIYKISQRIAFEIDLPEQTVRRIMRQRLR